MSINRPHLSAYGLRRVLVDAISRKPEGEDYRYPKVEVSEYGDEQCRYTEPGDNGVHLRPSCLIGAALAELDVTVGQLYDCEGQSAGNVLDKFFQVTTAVRNAATAAQREQDTGETWGAALDAYDRVLMNEAKHETTTVQPVKTDPWATTFDQFVKPVTPEVKPLSLIQNYYNGAVAAAL